METTLNCIMSFYIFVSDLSTKQSKSRLQFSYVIPSTAVGFSSGRFRRNKKVSKTNVRNEPSQNLNVDVPSASEYFVWNSFVGN